LNYPRLQNHPDYADWSIPLGRYNCFNMIKNMLAECHSISIGNSDIEKRRAPSGRLSKLLKDSVLY
jgi:hypothetical protein